MSTPPLSAKGAAFIASAEGLYTYTYDDGTGVLTIGLGHTSAAGGPKVTRGLVWSLEQCCAQFEADMKPVMVAVGKALHGDLMQFEADGWGSFQFNTGAISRGTCDDRWNAGDKAGAVAVLQQYNKGGGKVLAGLVTRRKAEAAMIRSGIYPRSTILVKDRAGKAGRSVLAESLPWGGAAPAASPPPVLQPSIMKPTGVVIPQKGNFLIELWNALWRLL